MLRTWLDDTPLADFLAHALGRQPMARPSSARQAMPLFEWPTLDRILGAPRLDVLVVRQGREWAGAPPRGLEELRPLLQRGFGVVVRRAERHDAGLAGLARSFARDLPGRIQIQLFATPAGSQGFGWHYDAEEVFIVQTCGSKDYYFRRNTLDPEPVLGAQPDFGRVRDETSPTMTCTLEPGDWLYLPRGWWHVAKARCDSLSISLGVVPSRPAGPPRRRD